MLPFYVVNINKKWSESNLMKTLSTDYTNYLKKIEEELYLYGKSNISELTESDYFLMLDIVPNCEIVSRIYEYLVLRDYIRISNQSLCIENIKMSTRLKNILLKNSIIYLPQLSAYPVEAVSNFRNCGHVAISELKEVCAVYNVEFRSMKSLICLLGKGRFSKELYYLFFYNNLIAIDDFKEKTIYDLYIMCSKDLDVTIRIYDSLKKNYVELKKWKDIFLFELLPRRKAKNILKNFNIETVSQLCNCSEKMLKKMRITFEEIEKCENMLE